MTNLPGGARAQKLQELDQKLADIKTCLQQVMQRSSIVLSKKEREMKRWNKLSLLLGRGTTNGFPEQDIFRVELKCNQAIAPSTNTSTAAEQESPTTIYAVSNSNIEDNDLNCSKPDLTKPVSSTKDGYPCTTHATYMDNVAGADEISFSTSTSSSSKMERIRQENARQESRVRNILGDMRGKMVQKV
jgi:hypothetical protein